LIFGEGIDISLPLTEALKEGDKSLVVLIAVPGITYSVFTLSESDWLLLYSRAESL
jgi:hypothetical protein